MSLIESGGLNGHDAWAYLKDILTKLPTWPNRRLAELLPHRWTACVGLRVGLGWGSKWAAWTVSVSACERLLYPSEQDGAEFKKSTFNCRVNRPLMGPGVAASAAANTLGGGALI